MALITCPDCGNSVSDAAPACIHCGRPLAAARPAYASSTRSLDPKAARAAEARPIVWVGYALQALSFLYGITAIVGLVVAYARRGDARGTWLESHFDWQIETFWNGFWTAVGAGILAVVLTFMTDSPGLGMLLLYPVGIGLLIWYVYRVVRGGLALYDGKPVA